MARRRILIFSLLIAGLLFTLPVFSADDSAQQLNDLKNSIESLNHRLDELEKNIDDVLWFERLGDVAYIEKVRIVGPPRWKELNPTAPGAGNPFKFFTYVFIPRNRDLSKKYPLIVLPHGGVHANIDSPYHTHIIREMLAQGYIVTCPDYRGSTGYGQDFYENIDYGGRENDDVLAARNYVVENYRIVDKDRVGIVGWSHGGAISLMNAFQHPEAYKVAFAGCPVSDLVARLEYTGKGYEDEFAAPYHIGKTVPEDIMEYRRRSPVFHVNELKIPLLVHTNTNDEDVNVLEVEHLIDSLKAAGKKFEYEIFKDQPGGHSFDRLDTMNAKTIRLKIYEFIGKYLDPPHPFKSVDDLMRAGYQE